MKSENNQATITINGETFEISAGRLISLVAEGTREYTEKAREQYEGNNRVINVFFRCYNDTALDGRRLVEFVRKNMME